MNSVKSWIRINHRILQRITGNYNPENRNTVSDETFRGLLLQNQIYNHKTFA